MSNKDNNGVDTNDFYDENINQLADLMIDKILKIFQDMVKGVPKIKSAIVHSVNQNGTVNITLPAEDENVYTNIQNQSMYQDLQPGDGVELLLKDGTFSNCWIIAKHGNARGERDGNAQ